YAAAELPNADRPLSVLSLPPVFVEGLRQTGVKTVQQLLRTPLWNLFQLPGVPIAAAQEVAEKTDFWLRRRLSSSTQSPANTRPPVQLPAPPVVETIQAQPLVGPGEQGVLDEQGMQPLPLAVEATA